MSPIVIWISSSPDDSSESSYANLEKWVGDKLVVAYRDEECYGIVVYWSIL